MKGLRRWWPATAIATTKEEVVAMVTATVEEEAVHEEEGKGVEVFFLDLQIWPMIR